MGGRRSSLCCLNLCVVGVLRQQLVAASYGARAVIDLYEHNSTIDSGLALTMQALDAVLDDLQPLSSAVACSRGGSNSASGMLARLTGKVLTSTISLLQSPTNSPALCPSLAHADLLVYGKCVARCAAIGVICVKRRSWFVGTLLARCNTGVGFGVEASAWGADAASRHKCVVILQHRAVNWVHLTPRVLLVATDGVLVSLACLWLSAQHWWPAPSTCCPDGTWTRRRGLRVLSLRTHPSCEA